MTTQNTIACLAVDDDFLSLAIIERCIKSLLVLNLVGTCSTAVEAATWLNTTSIDLLFLDVQLPDMLGTDLMLSFPNPPKVIFTTAYRKYAVAAFDLNAVDYLVKPISFTRFLKAVNRFVRLHATVSNAMADTGIIRKEQDFICLRSDRKNIKVNFHDILFIESLQDYCKIHTKDRTIVTKQSISVLADMLPLSFVRIHRSYVVSVQKIESYTTECVQIEKHQLPVSRSYRHEVETVLQTPLTHH